MNLVIVVSILAIIALVIWNMIVCFDLLWYSRSGHAIGFVMMFGGVMVLMLSSAICATLIPQNPWIALPVLVFHAIGNVYSRYKVRYLKANNPLYY